MERIKIFFKYLFFQDMGSLGEGCLVSAFIWFVIIFLVTISFLL